MIRWSRSQLISALLFVSVAWIWGGSFVAIEVGLHAFPPMWFAGLRYLIAGVVVSGVAVATGRFRPQGRNEWAAIGVVGVLIVAGYHGLLYLGEQSVAGPIAAVVVSLSPVLTGVVAGVLLPDEGPALQDGLGLLLGLAGVVVIADPGGSGVSLVGVALVLLGVLSFVFGSVALKSLDPALPPAAVQGWAMLVGSLLLVATAVARGEPFPGGHLSTPALASFAYLTLVAGVVGYLAYFALLKRVGPMQVNLVAYLEPVTAAMVAWAVLGRAPTPAMGTGFLLVFAGFVLAMTDEPLTRVTRLYTDPAPRPTTERRVTTNSAAGTSRFDHQAGD